MADKATLSRGHGDSTHFSTLVDLFDAVLKAKKGQLKRKHLSTFFNFLGRDYFSAMRLMIPELDKERGNYNVGADKLAKFTADALGLGKDSSDAKKLIEWKRGGARAGKSAGNFAMVAFEVLQNRQRETSGGLTIKELNELLDKLVAAEKREAKTAVLTELISKTNAREMKWIVNIILKDLKMGISEKTIFSEFHPDAEDIFNVTCDLRAVCEKLNDRTKRFARQDIEIGKAVRPQLAARANTVEQAMKKLRGRPVVVECKFDGERIQCHVNGTHLNFFSRNFNDHAEVYRDAIGDDIIKQTNSSRCILDGEIVVWNNVLKSFTPFGTNKTIAKQDGEGLKGDETLCYIIFDILYHEDRSLIHLPLRERHEILKKVVTPLKHRIEVLVPDAELNREPGVQPWTILPASTEEAQSYFLEMVENRDEGVIIKDMESKWEPADRSGRWAKVKPDYVNVETDLDVLIIGAMYGEGHRRGGQLSNFLLGMAERPKAGGFPTKFHSFCRVGTGFTETELDALRSRLAPYLRRNEKGSKPPSFYVCTGHHKERPDVWVEQPEKSVILQIKSDIRTIRTEVFTTPFSLRFPRCQKIRYDKPWYDCLDLDTYQDMVLASGGNVIDGARYTELEGTQGQKKRVKVEKAKLPLVPAHLMGTDVSSVKQSSTIFEGCVFYFANFAPDHSKDEMHRLVVEHGGSFSMNQIDAVTHMVADRKEGPYYQAAARFGDVIHTSWVFDCIEARELLHVRPKYYLHLSEVTRQNMRSEIDDFGDSYCDDLDTADLVQLFANMDPGMIDLSPDRLAQLEDKYDRGLQWGIFVGCHVYMHRPLHSSNEDSQAVASAIQKRLALDVRMYGGTATNELGSENTHLVVFATSDYPVTHDMVMRSLTAKERTLLRAHKIKIVSHQWIEGCLDNQRAMKDAEYCIRPESEDAGVEPTIEGPTIPLGGDSSDEDEGGPEPEVATPAKSSIYALNTRAPPHRSVRKQPPSVIKVRSRRDASGKKVSESEGGDGQIVPMEPEGGDGSEKEGTPTKLDIYALNMKPPPKGGRKKAGNAGEGRGRTRGSRGGDTVAAARPKRRRRGARAQVTSDDEEDDTSVGNEDGSDVVASDEEALDKRTRRGKKGGRLRGDDVPSDEGEVKAEPNDEARTAPGVFNQGEYAPGQQEGVKPQMDEDIKPHLEEDIKPEVASTGRVSEEKMKTSRRPTRGKTAQVTQSANQYVKQEAEQDTNQESREPAADERKLRTRALFTRKRGPESQGFAPSQVDTGPSRAFAMGVVKEEPVSQITRLDSQAVTGDHSRIFPDPILEGPKEAGKEHGSREAAGRPLVQHDTEMREGKGVGRVDSGFGNGREQPATSKFQFREPDSGDPPREGATKEGTTTVQADSGRPQEEEKHESRHAAPGVVEAGASNPAQAVSEEEVVPKKRRKVNFREQLSALGL